MSQFGSLKAPQLHEIAKNYKIKGHSKLKKGELLDLLNSRLRMLKSGDIKVKKVAEKKVNKIKGGKSAWGKIRDTGKRIILGSTGNDAGDAAAASLTGSVQQNPGNYSQQKWTDDTVDNYMERRASANDPRYTEADRELDSRRLEEQGKYGMLQELRYEMGGQGIVGGQLPGAILSKLKELEHLIKGGSMAELEERKAERDSKLQGLRDKGQDKAMTIGEKKLEEAKAAAIAEARQQSDKIYDELIQEDTEKDNPNFVRNPTNSKTLDVINKAPTLDDLGPLGDAIDKGGEKADKMLMKPFQAAMEAAGVPEDAAILITDIASPYSSIKKALKILKVTSRSGAVKPGERTKFAARLTNKAMLPPDLFEKGTDREQAEWLEKNTTLAQRKPIFLAALYGYDIRFPDSEETIYAMRKNKPPYDEARYRELKEDAIQMAEYDEIMKEREKLKEKMERDQIYMDQGTYFMTDEERKIKELMDSQGLTREQAKETYDWSQSFKQRIGGNIGNKIGHALDPRREQGRRNDELILHGIVEAGEGFGKKVGTALNPKNIKKVGAGAEEPIDWDDINWGSFTEQLKKYNSQYKKKLTLPKFADMILKDPKKYKSKTVKRARFYVNVLSKKK